MSKYVRIKMKIQKSIVLKRNIKNLMTSLLPVVKKMISNKINQINQIKSNIIQKIRPNKSKKRRYIPKRESNRGIKSLENNFRVIATKNVINTPKIVNNKPQIVAKPRVVTLSKMASKVKEVSKPKIVDKLETVIEKKHRITMNIKIV